VKNKRKKRLKRIITYNVSCY